MKNELPMTDVSPAEGLSPRAATFRLGRALDTGLRWLTEGSAALLVVVEVVLLFCNVFSRYVLNQPIVWGDELASLLFLWLAMLGSVVAMRRGEHMRLTSFIARLPLQKRAFVDTLGAVIVITFIGLLFTPAWEYVSDEWIITTAALEIPNAFRVSAIAVGLSLMLMTCVARLLTSARLIDFSVSVAMLASLGGLLWVAEGPLLLMGNWNLVIFFMIGVMAMIIIGVPIMVAFGLATVAYLSTMTGTPLSLVVGRMDEGMASLILLAIPLFVFLGALIEAMGMARAMINFLCSLIGHVRGGLSYVLIGAIYLISGISGSKAADMAAIAPALFPEMKKRGEDENELVAMLNASGAMSETIPPSLVLITIGSVTGVSIAALFTGGFMPAVVGAIAMAAVIWWKNRKGEASTGKRASGKEIVRSLLVAVPALALPFVIRTAVVEGVATATEVAAIGVAYTFIVGSAVLPLLRLAPPVSDPGQHRIVVRRDPDHHRQCDRHGLGPDPVGLLPSVGASDVDGAGGCAGFPDHFRRGVHPAGQFSGRHPGHRAVRAAAVPDCQGHGHPRRALRHGRNLRHGPGPVCPALRRGLLRRLRHCQGRPQRCDAPGLAVPRGAGRRLGRADRRAMDLHRFPAR